MKRVLLVDNNKVYRQVLALVLKWNTELKESAEADSLTQARRVLGNSNRKPDLAIVNVDAANADGVELMKELRMSAPEIPVLAITLRETLTSEIGRCERGRERCSPWLSPPRRSSRRPSGSSANTTPLPLFWLRVGSTPINVLIG